MNHAMYQEMILEHNRNPRNFKTLEHHTHHGHGLNSLCGDDYYLFIDIKNDIIQDIAFQGSGCAISKSSASMLTQVLKSLSIEKAKLIKDQFLNLLLEEEGDADLAKKLGKLSIFEGVKQYPIRVKCATLIWRAFESALINTSKPDDPITTTE
jgi:nitrogen fixation protein NifU and related proteins